uniref:Uncharacterized protein n=1 Tax=Anguilla anguilla TaxID=7936 RepID=A0A0E9WR71_ANGAN
MYKICLRQEIKRNVIHKLKKQNQIKKCLPHLKKKSLTPYRIFFIYN